MLRPNVDWRISTLLQSAPKHLICSTVCHSHGVIYQDRVQAAFGGGVITSGSSFDIIWLPWQRYRLSVLAGCCLASLCHQILITVTLRRARYRAAVRVAADCDYGDDKFAADDVIVSVER